MMTVVNNKFKNNFFNFLISIFFRDFFFMTILFVLTINYDLKIFYFFNFYTTGIILIISIFNIYLYFLEYRYNFSSTMYFYLFVVRNFPSLILIYALVIFINENSISYVLPHSFVFIGPVVFS